MRVPLGAVHSTFSNGSRPEELDRSESEVWPVSGAAARGHHARDPHAPTPGGSSEPPGVLLRPAVEQQSTMRLLVTGRPEPGTVTA